MPLRGTHSEASGPSSGAMHQQHPKPESHDSQHMPNQPRGSLNMISILPQGRKNGPLGPVNNFAGLSRKWVGVKLFMCFHFSWGKRETHKQNSQEISGKGRESPGTFSRDNSRDNPVKILFNSLFPGT